MRFYSHMYRNPIAGFRFAAMLCGLLMNVPLQAQTRPVEFYTSSLDTSQIQRYLNRASTKITENALAGLGDNRNLKANKSRLRQQFRYMIGLDPLPDRTPLNVRITGIVDRPDYTIEKIVFESMPGFYVTGNLYKPKSGDGPFPAVLYVCGHTYNPEGAKVPFQMHGQLMARNGYVLFIIDPIQVSEVYGIHHGTSTFNLWNWTALGYTPSGVEVWNAMRAVDYLKERSDVDGGRIGMTGMSGGGHISWFTGAADDRIHALIPANASGTVRMHVEEKIVNSHCDCAFFLNLYRFDWTTLAALIAPRPLRLHNATRDRIYPPSGYNKVLTDAEVIYRGYDRAKSVDQFEIVAAHRDTSVFRHSALEWFNRWFRNPRPLQREIDVTMEDPQVLSVLQGVDPPGNRNATIQNTFIRRAALRDFSTVAEWDSYKSELLQNLRDYTFRNLPHGMEKTHYRVVRESNGWRNFKDIVFDAEEGITLNARLVTPVDQSQTYPSLLYIASPGETVEWIYRFTRARYGSDSVNTLIVFPRGVGPDLWPERYRWYVRRAALLLGTTLHTMQLGDILAAIDILEDQPTHDGTSLTIFGKREMGALGLYAGALDPRITRVVLMQPPVSHLDNPIFMNVLRYTDLPQAAGLLAPKPIVFLGPVPAAYDYTRRIYALYGYQDNILSRATLWQAVTGL